MSLNVANNSSATDTLQGQLLSVALTVNDLEKSLAWYQEVMGFTVQEKHEREGKVAAVSLRAGSVRVLLGRDDGAKGWDRKKGEGISLQISTGQNIDAIADRIKRSGQALLNEPADMPWGVRMFRLRDPDGFLLTISSIRPSDQV